MYVQYLNLVEISFSTQPATYDVILRLDAESGVVPNGGGLVESFGVPISMYTSLPPPP